MTDGRGYHHGNLRQSLLDAAAEAVQRVGPAQVSLRELARSAGVSHAAPTHHFADKRGLFTALAAAGFRMLHERTSQVLGRPNALIETGRCYIEFALDHPGHFTVMFDVSLVNPEDPEFQRERGAAFEVLYDAIRGATRVRDEDELAAQALAAWLAVHGIATLWLSGNLPYERDAALVGKVLSDLVPALGRVADAGTRQAARMRADRSRSAQPGSIRSD